MIFTRKPLLTLVVILVAAAGLYAIALCPARFGFHHDDGVYAIMAKSLAQGHGYRILSLPGEPPQTKYPPLYPFLLSLIWRLSPDFPGNLTYLMALSALLVLSALAVTYGFFTRELHLSPGRALLIVGLSAFNWRVLVMSGSLYSEVLYIGISVAALWLVSRYARRERPHGLGVLAGLFLGLLFLTRTLGVTLIAASILYLLLQRAWRQMILILMVVALVTLPWLVWRRQAGVADTNATVASYTSYATNFRDTIDNPGMLFKVVRKNTFYLLVLFAPTVTLSLDYGQANQPLILLTIAVGFALIVLGFLRSLVQRRGLLEIYILCYVGVLLITPYTSYDRFLLPLLPSLWHYLLVQGERLIGPRLKVARGGPRRTWALACVGLVLGGTVLYRHVLAAVNLVARENPAYRQLVEKQGPVFRWVRENTDARDVLVCFDFDPLYYLHTGRQAVSAMPISTVYKEFFDPGAAREPVAEELLRIIAWSGSKYLILRRSFGPEFDMLNDVVRRVPDRFTLVFHPPDSDVRIYQVHPKL